MNGLCQCGCGQPTRLAPVTDRNKGWVKGEPLKFIKGHNVARDLTHRKGEDSQNWRGGRQKSTDGYVQVEHDGRRMYEHDVIAEEALDRPLKFFGPGDGCNEEVHHVDGDKANNARTNLLICTRAYHVSLHHRLARSANWPEFQRSGRTTKVSA